MRELTDVHLTQLLEMLGSATMSFVTRDQSEGCQPLHFQFICYMHRTNTDHNHFQ